MYNSPLEEFLETKKTWVELIRSFPPLILRSWAEEKILSPFEDQFNHSIALPPLTVYCWIFSLSLIFYAREQYVV